MSWPSETRHGRRRVTPRRISRERAVTWRGSDAPHVFGGLAETREPLAPGRDSKYFGHLNPWEEKGIIHERRDTKSVKSHPRISRERMEAEQGRASCLMARPIVAILQILWTVPPLGREEYNPRATGHGRRRVVSRRISRGRKRELGPTSGQEAGTRLTCLVARPGHKSRWLHVALLQIFWTHLQSSTRHGTRKALRHASAHQRREPTSGDEGASRLVVSRVCWLG